MSGIIHRKDLERVMNWLPNVLGMPCGDVYWLSSSGSAYETWFKKIGVDSDHRKTTLAAAYSAVTASRNDVILVAPGAYDEAATLDWSKSNTHLVGLGGTNTKSDYSAPNVVIYTDTSAVDYTIDLTGNHCIFKNIGVNNAGNSATNYSALRVNGNGNKFENASFIGNFGASQLSAVACGSLTIGTDGHNARFVDCVVGEDCWGARSGALSGQLIFNGSQPNGIRFTDCSFRSASNTTTVAMVRITPIAVGRDVIFDNCHFNNYGTSNLNQCFASSVNNTTHSWTQIILKNCHSHGIDRWTDHTVDYIYGTMPVADDGGGQSIALDETVAGTG